MTEVVGSRLFCEALMAGATCEQIAAITSGLSGLEVGTTDEHGWSPLRFALSLQRNDVVLLLLRHPGVDLNEPNHVGQTLAHYAVQAGREGILRRLLRHPRVDFSRQTTSGRTALMYAAFIGNEASVRTLLASGRDLGDLAWFGNRADDVQFGYQDDVSRGITDLLRQFDEDPIVTRHMLRLLPNLIRNWPEAAAAELFALVVLLCDGYLHLAGTISLHPETARFFRMSNRLPLELQMVLALRARRLAHDIISTLDSEPAFRSLLLNYLRSLQRS